MNDKTNTKIHFNLYSLPEGLNKLSKNQKIKFHRFKNEKGYIAKKIILLDSNQTGKCISWNNEKKCGTLESMGTKYYVHNTNIIGMSGYRKLEKGQNVNFEIYTNGANRTEAIKVQII